MSSLVADNYGHEMRLQVLARVTEFAYELTAKLNEAQPDNLIVPGILAGLAACANSLAESAQREESNADFTFDD